MFVPVTTKPYLNSFNFSVLQRVFLHFFLLIKEKTNQHFTSCLRNCSTYKLQCTLVSETWITNPASLPITLAGLFLLRFELHSLRSRDSSTYQSRRVTFRLYASLSVLESQIPRRYTPGIIRLTLQTSLRSLSASLIKI